MSAQQSPYKLVLPVAAAGAAEAVAAAAGALEAALPGVVCASFLPAEKGDNEGERQGREDKHVVSHSVTK